MGLQKKDTGQNFPPKIKDGKIPRADIKVFDDNKEPITNCFLDGIGGMTTGNGSTTGGTLWNGKKKDEKKYRLDLQGHNGGVSRFAFQKDKSVLAEVHLKVETLPENEDGSAIRSLLYDALLAGLKNGQDKNFTIWEVFFEK